MKAIYTLLLILAASAIRADCATYELAPEVDHELTLSVEKTGLLRGKAHRFVFSDYQGVLVFDPTLPQASRVDLSIAAATLTCTDTWVSQKDLFKIRAYALDEMLAAKQFPSIKFSSTGVRQISPSQYEVQGALTIRDLSNPATVRVSLERGSGGALTFSGMAQVRLTDYKLKPPAAALGAIGTKDEMTLSFRLAAKRRQETD